MTLLRRQKRVNRGCAVGSTAFPRIESTGLATLKANRVTFLQEEVAAGVQLPP